MSHPLLTYELLVQNASTGECTPLTRDGDTFAEIWEQITTEFDEPEDAVLLHASLAGWIS